VRVGSPHAHDIALVPGEVQSEFAEKAGYWRGALPRAPCGRSRQKAVRL